MARAATARAASEAARILKESGLGSIPIDVEAVAETLGLQVFVEAYDGSTSGVLISEEDGTRLIGINEGQPKTRQRFTIAHEIGHATMHLLDTHSVFVDQPRQVLFRDGRSTLATDRREIEANTFAAELLMPAVAIREYFGTHLTEVNIERPERIVDLMAKQFEVSPQAMSYRLINLHLLDPS